MWDRSRKERMRLARSNHHESVRASVDPHGGVAFRIRNHVVIFASSLARVKNLYRILQSVRFLEYTAHEKCHWRTAPLALTAAAHFANRHLLVVHASNRSNESGKRDVHKRNSPRRLSHYQHRMLLQFPIDAIIQNPAVQQSTKLRGFAEQRKSAAMKELGDRVGDENPSGISMHGVGDTLHFLDVTLGNIRPLNCKNRRDRFFNR